MLSDRIIIDGVRYNVPVSDVDRSADVLDKYANRTENGDLKRKGIGVYFNYQITFGDTTNTKEYNALFNKLTEPVEFHNVTVPASDGDYTFRAYITKVSDRMIAQYKGKNYFGELTASFTAKAPARKF
jgi:hypothetical protein|nr:MAG TPA: hypothetical protein [Caudoviricetes sp.]DAW07861.1 MAG TPA: hypothetical protein [Caudoviricetes sp.]